jgi:hypothetical protein
MSRVAVALAVVFTLFAPVVVFAQGATDCTFPGQGNGVGGTFPGGGNTGGIFPGCNGNGGGTAGGTVGGSGGTGGGGGTIHATASEPTMILTLAAGLILAGALRRR